MHQRVVTARQESAKQFEQRFANNIEDYDFKPADLVLVHNTRIEKELNCKSKPRYLGLYVVLRKTSMRNYVLAELDGAISAATYRADRLIPYCARRRISIDIEEFIERTGAHSPPENPMDELTENDHDSDPSEDEEKD